MFKKLFSKNKDPLKNRVEFCVSNRAYCDPEIYDVLEERENLIVEDTGCNSYCEICDYHFYALVNGEPIFGDSAKELLEKVEEELKVNSVE